MKTTHYFRFRMERPHQFGFGTWADAIRMAREIEATYGLDVFIDEFDSRTAQRMTERENVYFCDIRKRDWE